jgi:hypothetical protein
MAGAWPGEIGSTGVTIIDESFCDTVPRQSLIAHTL